MKKAILTFALMTTMSMSAVADPIVFGMELGKSSEEAVGDKYSVQSLGLNKFTNGNMYSIPPSEIDFRGIEKLTVIFSKEGVLSAVLAELSKGRYDEIDNALGKKYRLIEKREQFVGDQFAVYKDGNTQISIKAPHMSFSMALEYVQADLLDAFNKQTAIEEKKRKASEASQL